MSGRVIAVVGPSGVGKDTVMQALAARDSRFRLARRVITRPAEAGGEMFEGVGEAEFRRRAEAGAFALSWQAHGLSYGIPAGISDALDEGCDVLVNLSRRVLPEAQARFPRLDVILLTADRTVLARRLSARGRECAEDIERRLGRAALDLPEGIAAHRIDNSGPIETTVQAVLRCLYPVRA
ncbi:phosphonate metabolism protein/1,5-bisphosphokinase (PRPP-forming) PhnN [Oceaniglobus roseus]|uniref:phosphonate metabolism protein/1,5-bisphosphokinase (PRPP-forming) PhnN n=1 Tax=Oceaniglobus roseus TaxID=1737570 RepID=UPI000C7E944F|nr:phosphonate metabolism protein/1,5-bisphosphokinase (PRPP-forming) PhnN [Kandeliimicrobium roseum]